MGLHGLRIAAFSAVPEPNAPPVRVAPGGPLRNGAQDMNAILRRTLAAALAGALAAGLAGCESNPMKPRDLVPPLDSLSVAPDDTTLTVGQSATFVATAIDTGGTPVAPGLLTWTSGDRGVFTVTTSGLVVARGEGTARLVVSGGGRADTAWVTVLPTRTGWFTQVSGTANTLNGVFVQPDGRRVWAVGNGGRIVRTTDAGEHWSTQVSNTAFNLNAVWFTSDLEGWAVGNNGTLLRTVNAGAQWVPRTSGTSDNLMDVCFATPDTGWAVGTNGTVLRTFDRGTTWQKSNPTASALHGVSFAGTRLGWAVGDNGTIVGTTDRGLSWDVVTPSITSQALRGVWRRSTLVAVAAGAQGVTPRTVDGGGGVPQWVLANAGAANGLEGVCFPSDLTGYAVGYNGTGLVLRSDDGGASWSPQAVGTGFRLNDVHFIDATRGWAVGESGVIVHTATGGQ
jgi:photosystem II stability/assembly factor-like uncharacterized protein